MSIHSLIKKYAVAPKKRLGQHFLAAAPTIEKIVRSAEIKDSDIVLEIGPGLGLMTRLIAERAAHVIAIDADSEMIEIAKNELVEFENITWIRGNVLKSKPESLALAQSCPAIKIVGNIPYNISSPIIFWMIENRKFISQAIITIQKEVADRITSAPGSKNCGILSVLLARYSHCNKLFKISPKSFIPPPKIESAVVRIDFTDAKPSKNEDGFKKVVKAAFGQRRKTLRNALIGSRNLGINSKALDEALKTCGIDGRRRAETLSVEEFERLAYSVQKIQ